MAAVAVAAPLHWWSVAVHGRRREWVLKPLVLALLIVTAWFLGASGSATGWWLLVALGLSLVGDIALLSDRDALLDIVRPGDDRRAAEPSPAGRGECRDPPQ